MSLTSPADGSTVSGADVRVVATASDDNGVTHVEFLLDGSRLGIDSDPADGWAIGWDSTTANDGAHSLVAVATDTAGQTASASISVTVDNSGGTTDPGGSATVHVGDLDGSAAGAKNQWYASVAVTVVDGAGTPVSDAKVDGTWTTSNAAGTCTTDATGTCTLTSERVPKSTESLTFRVDAVTHPTLGYDPGANTDPDGDSDGTIIMLTKPL